MLSSSKRGINRARMSDHGRRVNSLAKGPCSFSSSKYLKHESALWVNASSICDNGMNNQGIEYRIDHGKQSLTSRSRITDSDFDRQRTKGNQSSLKPCASSVAEQPKHAKRRVPDAMTGTVDDWNCGRTPWKVWMFDESQILKLRRWRRFPPDGCD